MKKIVLVSMMLLLTVSGFGRTRVSENAVVVADTLFYGVNHQRVNSSDEAGYYRLLKVQGNGMAKEDVFQDFYMDGTLRAEGGYNFIDLNNDNNTVLNGEVTTYYVNGREKLRGKYVDGKRNGYFTLQMRDGGVAVVVYKQGRSVYDYFIITRQDGSQERRPVSEIASLLQ